jgi:hypothetical protein
MSAREPRPTPANPEAELRTAQEERARGTWLLVIRDDPRASVRVRRAVRSVLRIHRAEAERLLGRLPGVARRGARIDLAPLHEALCAAGIRAELVRSDAPVAGEESGPPVSG